MSDSEYALLKKKIRQHLDIDLDAYKTQQMRRRLGNFVSNNGGRVSQFARRLDTDAELRGRLRDMLTINVSEFFRDAGQFAQLRSTILPELLKRSHRFSIWSAGCSRGQEPFSLAMILSEMAALRRARILATDLDRDSLLRAKSGGPYSQDDLRSVPRSMVQKYFEVSPEGYTVTQRIREIPEFREHNLLSDPFPSAVDLIICRNVTIYFSSEIKSDLARKFHQSLKPGGVLFIGGTEALIGAEGSWFQRLSGNFYRKAAASATTRGKLVAVSRG
jgi:chemotaxis protein methyltransferase CheR